MSVTLDKISNAPELSDTPKHTKSAAAETAAARTAAASTAAGRTQLASSHRGQPRPKRALPLGAKHYVGLILPAALITLWYVLSTAGVFTAVQLPSPTRVIAAGTELAQRGELATHLVISTQRVVLGFSIGAVLGCASAMCRRSTSRVQHRRGAGTGSGGAYRTVGARAHRRSTHHWGVTRRALTRLGSVAAAVDRHRRKL